MRAKTNPVSGAIAEAEFAGTDRRAEVPTCVLSARLPVGVARSRRYLTIRGFALPHQAVVS